MAIALDLAKVVSVSFLYNNWDKLGYTIRSYILAAVVVLMAITSTGVYGYLSDKFMTAIQPINATKIDAEYRKREILHKEDLLSNLTARRDSIDAQINSITADKVREKQRLIYTFDAERRDLSKQIKELNTEILELHKISVDHSKTEMTTATHLGPLVFIANSFGIDIETAAKYVIFVIVGVFDPLAICLLIAGNFAYKKKQQIKEPRNDNITPDVQPIEAPPPKRRRAPKNNKTQNTELLEFENKPDEAPQSTR